MAREIVKEKEEKRISKNQIIYGNRGKALYRLKKNLENEQSIWYKDKPSKFLDVYNGSNNYDFQNWNRLILAFEAVKRGAVDNRFMTLKQADELSYSLNKGSRAYQVETWNKYQDKETGQEVKFLSYYSVFNAADFNVDLPREEEDEIKKLKNIAKDLFEIGIFEVKEIRDKEPYFDKNTKTIYMREIEEYRDVKKYIDDFINVLVEGAYSIETFDISKYKGAKLFEKDIDAAILTSKELSKAFIKGKMAIDAYEKLPTEKVEQIKNFITEYEITGFNTCLTNANSISRYVTKAYEAVRDARIENEVSLENEKRQILENLRKEDEEYENKYGKSM